MSDNKIMEQASNAIINGLRETIDELSYENDEINRKWAEDNERNGDVCSEQQEQIIALEEENKKLKSQLHDLNIAFFTSSSEEREEIKKLKKQIPQKPGKKLSQRDKLVLSYLRGMLDVFNKEDKEREEGDDMHGEWCDDETLKLLDRLIK